MGNAVSCFRTIKVIICRSFTLTPNSRYGHQHSTIPFIPCPDFSFQMSTCDIPDYLNTRPIDREILPNGWYNGPNHPLLFDTKIERDSDDTLVRQQFSLPCPLGRWGPTIYEDRTLFACTRLQDARVDEYMQALPYMMCEGRVITITSGQQSVYIMSTPGYIEHLPTSPGTLCPSELVSLGDREQGHRLQRFSFDPCSGRLLQLSDDGTTFLVSEYLRTPHLTED